VLRPKVCAQICNHAAMLVTSEHCCYCYSDLNCDLDVSTPHVRYVAFRQMKQDKYEYVQVILHYSYGWTEPLLRVYDTRISK